MVIWLIYGLFKPYTNGCASDGEMLIRGLPCNDHIRRVFLVTEYARGELWRSEGKVTLLRILPRRDSREFNGRLRRSITFVIEHAILLALVLFVGIFRRKDVVHFHSRLVYPWTGFAVRLVRVRALADVRDNFADARSVAAFPLSVYVSRQIYDGLRRCIPEQRLVHVPVPLDTGEIAKLGRRGTPARELSRPYFLFVGTLYASKGILELIEAYREYRRIHGSASPQLVLAGENRLQRDGLESQIDPNTVPGVTSLGSIPREDVYALMAGADRLILPSKAEGMPRVCLEAMALGVPVICPPRVVEFETWCPQCVLREITPAAILEMLEQPRESLIAKDYPLEQHDWQGTVERYLAVYRKLAA
jgi:glycosyltransferase involved in cell wall biosynthesis